MSAQKGALPRFACHPKNMKKKTVYTVMLPSPEIGLPMKQTQFKTKLEAKDWIDANKNKALPFEYSIEKIVF